MKALILALFMVVILPLQTFAKSGEEIAKEIKGLHAQIALKLAQARANGQVCEAEAYIHNLVSELVLATSYNSQELAALVRKNPIFVKLLGKNLAFRRHVLGQFSYAGVEPKELEKAFIGSTIYSLGSGAYGSTTEVSFNAGGILKIRQLDVETMKWGRRAGTFRILAPQGEKNLIELDLGGEKGKVTLELKWENGFGTQMLVPVGAPSAFDLHYNTFSSEPSECEA